ncbi:MAG: hypothetical protein IT479_14470 [Xanthomonadales bacterium]|nr:hypothetical protein [Xanthomonadales bacterium]MCC6594466.1 hypothetical protein [Xanthomonadales bacterium]MCE7932429.1 hypothetical protein [Xanthomonadales bacterium PRO6]
MLSTQQWIGLGFVAALVVALFAGSTDTGYSVAVAATTFGSLASALALVLVWLGLQGQNRELTMQREELRLQREHMAKSARLAQRGASPTSDIPGLMNAPEDPRLFLRPESSMGDSAIVLVLKNHGAQIWGVSLYWHHQDRTHFIDETHPTLAAGGEIIAFIQRNELPEQFQVTVSYTKRNGQEQEERWSITEDAAGFDCTYDGKVAGSAVHHAMAH